MKNLIDKEQKILYEEFKEFVRTEVEPDAGQWDQDKGVPRSIIDKVSEQGYVGSIIPSAYGGQGWSYSTYGLLNEAFGRGSSSLTVLFTVQHMVSTSLMKWGSQKQIDKWLEPMAKGEILASFALTEPGVGSNIKGVETEFDHVGDVYVLNGSKKWITFAATADLYLIFGKSGDKSVAGFVERDTPGLTVTPLHGMLGFKGCHLAQLDFDNVIVPEQNMVGRPGFALSYIAPYGLHYGRLSTAFSSLGLLRACLEESSNRSITRKVSDQLLIDKGSICEKIANMGVNYDVASLLCWSAVQAEDSLHPGSIEKMISAKYFASKKAVEAANDAVQIHGASGCHEGSSPVSRYYRDSKIMEIIEGTTQVLEDVLGKSYAKQYSNKKVEQVVL